MRFVAGLVFLTGLTTGCDKPPVPAPPTNASTAAVTFGDAFYKEEAASGGSFRWARQTANLTIDAPSEGTFEITLKPVTVFSAAENTIEVSVGGRIAGTVSTHTFDLSNPQVSRLRVNLKQGPNAIGLKSSGPEVRLGVDDERSPAFGLVLPVTVGKAP